ncbi:MAG TPA: FAD-dependent thymidylate synthase [Phycisphaerae bacterium]|nr:FAD-dependent thymidylate synthase [Phycisphaerae bacterium]
MEPTEAKVTLVRHTPDAARLLAAAAKLCYASDTEGLFEQQDGDDAERFVRLLREMGHLSPVEHATFTFFIEGVSRAMTHQLVRHRLASYSQRSQRYVGHGEFDYVVPPALEGKTVRVDGEAIDAVEYFRRTMETIAERYRRLAEALGAPGEAGNQDARYVLPNACETKILVTMNARELLHFFEERLCLRAQWEIRGVAQQMLLQMREHLPAVFEGVGPKCVRLGRCPEGTRTCGRRGEVARQYAAGPEPDP